MFCKCKKSNIIYSLKQLTSGRILLFPILLCIAILPSGAFAKELIGIRIWPPNVGVLVENKTQSFTAYGVYSDGSEADFTNKVGWTIEANPFPDQELLPHQIAEIDKNGIVTLIGTWGRVNVTATYPPPPDIITLNAVNSLLLRPVAIAPTPVNVTMQGILSLLLKNDSSMMTRDFDFRTSTRSELSTTETTNKTAVDCLQNNDSGIGILMCETGDAI